MANRFLSNIRINDAYTFPASDGSNGQFIKTDGSGNLSFADPSASSSASVIYRDNFTGDGSTVVFDLQNSLTTEDQSFIYIDGVYQEKDTYSLSSTQITFTTAPISGHSIEVISIAGINTGPTVIYQDNFTGNGSSTDFTLAQVIDNEVKTFVFLNGVYQFKGTYAVDSTTLSFDTAPANGVDIEVISIASAAQTDSLQAGAVIIPVKNTHTASIAKGEPVYITGNIGNSARLQIAPADASDSAKMPSAGLLLTTLAVNEEGYVITGGYLRNLTTDTIDGTSTSSNDTVYVKAGGGLTMTKPTGGNLIQNVAKVARSSGGSSGSLLVSSILRTNDIPNLTTGKIWVGDGNTTESTVVHLDESNNRLGINNNSPNYSLDVTGDANISSNVIIGGNLTVDGTQTILNTQTVEVEDNILQLNTTQGSPDTATATTSGISVYRGDGVTQASFIFDDADDTWDLTNNLVVDGNATINGFFTSQGIDDNANATAITINGNEEVGIGTLTPFYKLDVNGTFRASGNATFAGSVSIESLVNANIGNLSITSTNNDASGLSFKVRSSPSDPTNSRSWMIHNNYSAAGTLEFLSSTTATGNPTTPRMVIDNSGNVGIGETSPSSYFSPDLVVKAKADLGGITIRSNATSHNNYLMFADGTSGNTAYRGYVNYNHSADSMNFGTAAGLRMTIDSSGNVGIGETSPNAKLDVPGNVKLGSAAHSSWTDAKQDVGGLDVFVGSGSNAFQVWDDNQQTYPRFKVERAGNVGIGTDSPDTLLNVEGSSPIITIEDSRTSIGDGTIMGRIDFKQNDDSGSGTGVSGSIYSISQSTTGQGSGLAFNTGVPSSATERMRIDSSGTISIGPSTTSSEIYFNYNNTNNKGGLKIDYSTGELRLTAGESGNTYRQAFYLNGSERMRIDNSGNIRFTGTAPSSGDEITQLNFYNTSSSLNLARITGIRQAGGTNYGALTFSTTNSGTIAERMRITSAGNVGIGTTSPNADLEVYTDIGGGNTLRLNTNFGGGNTVDINPYITGINNGGMEIKLAGSQKVVINPSGNVGIGTTSPAQKLDVVGIIKSSGISNSLMFSDRNTASNSWEWYSSGNNAGLYKNHNGPGTVMTIDSSDNVGIGTTSPQTKLDVDGGVRIKTVEYTWHRANPITSTDSYRHIKTTLYAGSGGNTMHIMGGFTLKAYAYASGGYGEGSCMFHNWSGILYSLSVTNRGQWSNFVRSPYISSDGYVVIVFEHNTYSQPVIDFYQFYTPYGWRNVTVSADTTSNSSTGVY